MAAENGSTDLVYTYLVARDDQPKLADRVGVKELLDEALHLDVGHYHSALPFVGTHRDTYTNSYTNRGTSRNNSTALV